MFQNDDERALVEYVQSHKDVMLIPFGGPVSGGGDVSTDEWSSIPVADKTQSVADDDDDLDVRYLLYMCVL